MARSALLKRNRDIFWTINSGETKALAEKLRQTAGLNKADLKYLGGIALPERRKHLDILLKGKNGGLLSKFVAQICKRFPAYRYILLREEARYFMAELFLTDIVCADTLEQANLTGISWVKPKSKKDTNLYLSIAPGTNIETINTFLKTPHNDPKSVFQKHSDIPYIEPALRPKKENQELLFRVVPNLNALSTQALENIIKQVYPKEFKVAFDSKDKTDPRRKNQLVSFYVYHAYGFGSPKNEPYSDGAIRSIIQKSAYKPRRKKSKTFSRHS